MGGNAKSLGYVPYVGDGSAVLSTVGYARFINPRFKTNHMVQVHLMDVVPFLLKLIERAASGPAEGSVYSRWYNLETQRVSWKALATELAKVMHAKGLVQSPEPRKVSMEEAGNGEVQHLVAANMLLVGNRAATAGFSPSHSSILQQMHEDLKDATL